MSTACGPSQAPDPADGGTSGGPANESSSSGGELPTVDETGPDGPDDSGAGVELGPCGRLADCIDATDEAITPFLAAYGPNGTCWQEFTADQCWQDCRALFDAYTVECGTIATCCECVDAGDCAYDPSFASCSDSQCVQGGSDGTADAGGTVPSHAADVYPIIEAYCVSECHEPGGIWPVFDQSVGAAEHYDTIVGMPAPTQAPTTNLIEPGDPMTSYLWAKLTNTHMALGGVGLPMPDKRPSEAAPAMLAEDELALIEAWILAGAPP